MHIFYLVVNCKAGIANSARVTAFGGVGNFGYRWHVFFITSLFYFAVFV